jgi:hypothetical protein
MAFWTFWAFWQPCDRRHPRRPKSKAAFRLHWAAHERRLDAKQIPESFIFISPNRVSDNSPTGKHGDEADPQYRVIAQFGDEQKAKRRPGRRPQSRSRKAEVIGP